MTQKTDLTITDKNGTPVKNQQVTLTLHEKPKPHTGKKAEKPRQISQIKTTTDDNGGCSCCSYEDVESLEGGAQLDVETKTEPRHAICDRPAVGTDRQDRPGSARPLHRDRDRHAIHAVHAVESNRADRSHRRYTGADTRLANAHWGRAINGSVRGRRFRSGNDLE